jgi:hypothetical protein
VHAAEDGALLATKSISTKPVIAVQQCGHTDMYAVATSQGVALLRLQRDLVYEGVGGSHNGPVVSIYACTGGLVCAPDTCNLLIAINFINCIFVAILAMIAERASEHDTIVVDVLGAVHTEGMVLTLLVVQARAELDFRIFSASRDNTMCLWDPKTLDCLHVFSCLSYLFDAHDMSQCSPSSDSRARDGKSNLSVDCESKGALQISIAAQVTDRQLSELSCATFFEAWNVLVSGHQSGEVALWSLGCGQCFCVLRQHANTVSCMTMALAVTAVRIS